MKPHQAMATIRLVEDVESDLFEDTKNFLDPENAQFYGA
jgi:hypothetical protein